VRRQGESGKERPKKGGSCRVPATAWWSREVRERPERKRGQNRDRGKNRETTTQLNKTFQGLRRGKTLQGGGVPGEGEVTHKPNFQE